MDLSALESNVKALESSLESIELLVTVSTILVVVGLVVEYWFPLCELLKALKNKPPFPWKMLFEMIGGLLVTIGVAGELWFQSRASLKEALLRTDSHEIEGLLNAQAGNANDRAKKADDRATLAFNRSTDAQHLADKAGTDLIAARKQLQQGQIKLAQEQQKASKAQAEALDLQKKVNGSFLHRLLDRHVDVRLKESLKTLPPAKAEIQVVHDPEAIVLAIELRNTLTEVGWTVPEIAPPSSRTPVPNGVKITSMYLSGTFVFGPTDQPQVLVELLKSMDGGRMPDERLVSLILELKAGSFEADAALGDNSFRIVIGTNVFPNGFPLPPR